MKLLLFTLLMLQLMFSSAQLPEIYLKPRQAIALGELGKTATLMVVIENEKNPDDAALVSAVKNNWHIGPVKYMSTLEFAEKFKSNNFDRANLYLFNNLKQSITPYVNMASLTFYSGFYLTNSPLELASSRKASKAPPYLHFSGNTMADKKGIPNKGFYELMIKNFNYDMKYCQDQNNFKTNKKKLKRKKGIYFFNSDSIQNKTILLVKEQTARREKNDKPDAKKIKKAAGKKEYSTDAYTNSKIPIIVFPEDIEYAVKHNDSKIMLFTGGCLYNAGDGSVYATIREQPKKMSFGGLFGVVSLLASIGTIVFIATN